VKLIKEMTMKKDLKKMISISALVLIGLGTLGLRFYNDEKNAAEMVPLDKKSSLMGLSNSLVQIEEIKHQDVQDDVQMTGKLAIDSLRLQQISARVPGRVDRLAMVEGQPVKVGQALAWIYSPEFISAQNEFLLAKRTAKTLNTASTQDLFEDAKATLESARNKLRIIGASQQDIELLETRGAASEFLTVTASMTGVITKRNIDSGGYLNTGDSLGSVADLSSVWFLGNVFESDLPKLKLGQQVDIQVMGSKLDQYQGRISFISPTFDPQTHAVVVRVDLSNPKGELKPDMFAKAHVRVGMAKLPVVPRVAVVQDGAQSFVIVKKADGQFKRVAVSAVPANDNDHLAITKGIEVGDQVVTDGGVLVDRSLVNAAKTATTPASAVVKP
jgi:Cu(I)/Ag(I) efflux system membrane fusion protein